MRKYIHTTWRLWKLLKPFHRELYSQLILISCIGFLDIYWSVMLGKIVNAATTKDYAQIYSTLALFALWTVAYYTFNFIRDYRYQIKFIRNSYMYLREFSLTNLLKLNISQLTQSNSSINYDVLSTGEEKVVSYVQEIMMTILPVFVLFISASYFLFSYSIVLGVFSLLGCALIFGAEFYFNKARVPLQRKRRELQLNMSKISKEVLTHFQTVKVFSVGKKFINNYLVKRIAFVNFATSVDRSIEIQDGVRNYFIGILVFASAAISTYLFINDYIAAGTIFTILSINSQIFWRAKSLQTSFTNLIKNYIDVERYLELIDMVPDFNENGKNKFVDGDITFTNLSFKYPKGESNVLEDINLSIPKGKKVAFVGASGSGKTTITRLLLRAYDYSSAPLSSGEGQGERMSSSITINGIELKDIDSHSLRRSVGYVEQHVDLFDDTIKNNILFGVDEKVIKKWEKSKPDSIPLSFGEGLGERIVFGNMLEERLEEVAKLARIDEFYHRLGEAKLETEIGERGIKLSGGERQRIGIARAIIKDPAILIFDEATSALDTVNEKYIKEAIDNVSKGRTTIIIAHRLSTVIDSDIIFVMDKGKLVASGTHDELLVSSPYYQDLIMHQELK